MSIIERALAKAKQEDRAAVEDAEGLAHQADDSATDRDLLGERVPILLNQFVPRFGSILPS